MPVPVSPHKHESSQGVEVVPTQGRTAEPCRVPANPPPQPTNNPPPQPTNPPPQQSARVSSTSSTTQPAEGDDIMDPEVAAGYRDCLKETLRLVERYLLPYMAFSIVNLSLNSMFYVINIANY